MNEFFNQTIGKAIDVSNRFKRQDGDYWNMVEPCVESTRGAIEFYSKNESRLSDLKVAAREYAIAELDWRKNSRNLCQYLETAVRRSDDDITPSLETVRRIEPQDPWLRERFSNAFRIKNFFTAQLRGQSIRISRTCFHSETKNEIAEHGYVLTPGRYAGEVDVENDDERFDEKMQQLHEQFAKSAKLEAVERVRKSCV